MEIISRDVARQNGLKHFYTNKKCKNGHLSKRFVSNNGCAECLNAHCKIYYSKNKSYFKEKDAKWLKLNAHKNRERSRIWRINNLQLARSMDKRYKKNNKEKVSFDTIKRRRRKTSLGEFTFKEWEHIKKLYKYTCLSCKKTKPHIKLTQDHVIPISKGGSNSAENIQPLCRVCNCKKGTKIIDYRLLTILTGVYF